MLITSKTFQGKRFGQVVKLAGLRYETNVNVQLPIRSLLHALIKSTKFCDELINESHELFETAEYIGRKPFDVHAAEYKCIRETKESLVEQICKVAENNISTNVRPDSILAKCETIQTSINEATNKLDKAESDGAPKS